MHVGTQGILNNFGLVWSEIKIMVSISKLE